MAAQLACGDARMPTAPREAALPSPAEHGQATPASCCQPCSPSTALGASRAGLGTGASSARHRSLQNKSHQHALQVILSVSWIKRKSKALGLQLLRGTAASTGTHSAVQQQRSALFHSHLFSAASKSFQKKSRHSDSPKDTLPAPAAGLQ